MPPVELHPAYVWDCDTCGRENFERGIVPELSDEDFMELREAHGIEPKAVGRFMVMPDSVKCRHCGARFETQQYSEA